MTNRECYTLPEKIDNDIRYANPDFESQMDDMKYDLLEQKALLVYLTGRYLGGLPHSGEITAILPSNT